jgi:hypothetical protein
MSDKGKATVKKLQAHVPYVYAGLSLTLTQPLAPPPNPLYTHPPRLGVQQVQAERADLQSAD